MKLGHRLKLKYEYKLVCCGNSTSLAPLVEQTPPVLSAAASEVNKTDRKIQPILDQKSALV